MDLPKCTKCGKVTAILGVPVLVSYEASKKTLLKSPMAGGGRCRHCMPAEALYIIPLPAGRLEAADILAVLENEVAKIRLAFPAEASNSGHDHRSGR